MPTDYCPHPLEEVTITPANSRWGGAVCYCAACGDHWYATQRELDARKQEPAKPVQMCGCGTVLETPAKYAEHCAAFPSHFTTT